MHFRVLITLTNVPTFAPLIFTPQALYLSCYLQKRVTAWCIDHTLKRIIVIFTPSYCRPILGKTLDHIYGSVFFLNVVLLYLNKTIPRYKSNDELKKEAIQRSILVISPLHKELMLDWQKRTGFYYNELSDPDRNDRHCHYLIDREFNG